MNEKKNNRKFIIVMHIIIILVICGAITAAYFFGRAYKTDSTGTGNYSSREREILERIGEYTDRESDRIDAERNRLATEGELNQRENDRIDAEGSRLERDKNSTGAIRELNRRSGDLLQQLKEASNSMANN
jgi:hypothetical protein